jgi:acyl carrier protein
MRSASQFDSRRPAAGCPPILRSHLLARSGLYVFIVTEILFSSSETWDYRIMSSNPHNWERGNIDSGRRNETLNRIRSVLLKHGRLGKDAMQLAENDDLYAAGMTSLASVNVMLALESEFEVEFPDQMLNRSMFITVGAIEAALRKAAGA